MQDVLAPSHKLHTIYSEHKPVSLNPLGFQPTHWLHHTSQWLQSFQTASIHGPLEHACLGCRQRAMAVPSTSNSTQTVVWTYPHLSLLTILNTLNMTGKSFANNLSLESHDRAAYQEKLGCFFMFLLNQN